MSHTINYNSLAKIVEAKVRGDVNFTETIQLVADIASHAAQRGASLFLIDFAEASMALSTMEIYQLPKIFAAQNQAHHLQATVQKRAFVAGRNLDDFLFFETVAHNQGQYIRMFRDVDRARKWLTEPNNNGFWAGAHPA